MMVVFLFIYYMTKSRPPKLLSPINNIQNPQKVDIGYVCFNAVL